MPFDAELIVQLWNDNSPDGDVLVGEARASLSYYFHGDLGTEHILKLSLTRHSEGQKGGAARVQGNLSFYMVVNLAREFFNEINHGDKASMPKNELRVAVIQARNLPTKGKNVSQQLGMLDPVVSLSCRGECASSSVKHKSSFPVWNETFSLRVCSSSTVAPLDLEVALDAWGDSSKRSRIACVAIPLAPLKDGAVRRKWYHLLTRSDVPSSTTAIADLKNEDVMAHGARASLSSTQVELELALHWKHRSVLHHVVCGTEIFN